MAYCQRTVGNSLSKASYQLRAPKLSRSDSNALAGLDRLAVCGVFTAFFSPGGGWGSCRQQS